MIVPGSLRRIQSINKHNRAGRTNSDISCKKTNIFHFKIFYFIVCSQVFPSKYHFLFGKQRNTCTFTTHKKYIAGYVILCIEKQEQSKTQHLHQGWKFPPHCINCVSGSRLGLNFPENINMRCLDSSCSYHSVSLWRYDTICPFSTNLKRVKNPSKSVIMQIWIKT